MAGSLTSSVVRSRKARPVVSLILWVPALLTMVACGAGNPPSAVVPTAVPVMLGTPPMPTPTVPAYMEAVRTPGPVQRVAAVGTSPAAVGSSLYLAAAAHVAGSHGTNWRTDVGVHVGGHEDGAIDVDLLRHGRDNTDPRQTRLTLDAGKSVDIEDVLATEFGVAGKSALRLSPRRGSVAVASRTYNLLAEGNDLGLPAGATFGQFIPGLLESAAIAGDEQGRLIQLSHDRGSGTGARTNIGMVNITGADLAVAIDLYDADGTLFGTVTRQLQPFEYRQLDRIFESVTGDTVADGYAVIRPVTDGGAVMAYASIVDNLTGDPIAVIARTGSIVAGAPAYIVAGAHVSGAAGTNWRTDLELNNGGSAPIDCGIDLLVHGQANPSPETATVSLQPGHSLRLTDVLLELFGFSGQAALRITPNGTGLTVTSRTYNLVLEGHDLGLPAGATFGQYIAPVTFDEALTDRDEGRLIQLAENQSFRTNLVLVSATSAAVTVEIELFASDGSLLGTVVRELAPYEYRQLNRVFRMVTTRSVRGGYSVVRTSTPGGTFFALASVVDNITGDPVAVPAVRYRSGVPPGVEETVTGVMEGLGQLEQVGISLEHAASAANSLGLDGVIDAMLLVGPEAMTRTETGLRTDWGTEGVGDQGLPVSGSADMDLSGLVLSSTSITGSVSETYHGLVADGRRPLTDRVTWAPTIDIGASGSLEGTIDIEGGPFDPEQPGLATIGGSVEIDTEVCAYYPVAGTIVFEVDGVEHSVTFGPQCDGSFDYDGPGGDLSQFHNVTIRVFSLAIQLRFSDPDECGDGTTSRTSTFIWNFVDGSFVGRTYYDWFQLSYPEYEETNEVTLTVGAGSDRLDFTASVIAVTSTDPDAVITRTTTITGTDVPTLFTGSGFETLIPGPGICDYLTVDVEQSTTAGPCVWVLDTVQCRDASGLVVQVY